MQLEGWRTWGCSDSGATCTNSSNLLMKAQKNPVKGLVFGSFCKIKTIWCLVSVMYGIKWWLQHHLISGSKEKHTRTFFSSELFITEPLFRNYHWLTSDIFSSVNYFCKCFSSLTKMPSSWHDSDFLSFIISSWHKVCVYVCIHFCFISSFINTFFNFKVSYKF